MADHGQHSCTCVVAFGTRGDIVPLVGVLRELIQRASYCALATKWLFVTHECFVEDLKGCLPSCVEVQCVHTSPITTSASEEDNFRSCAELDNVFSSLESVPVTAVISNLFALEAWAFALRRNIKHIIIHPNQPAANTEARDYLLGSFVVDYPAVCTTLQSRTQSHTSLDWSDCELWLWPTLTNLDATMAANIPLYDKTLTVLIMSSPLLVGEGQEWRAHPRYHLCGAIEDGHLDDCVLLQPITTDSGTSTRSVVSAIQGSLCVVCIGTDEALMHIGPNTDTSGDTRAVVCVDIGSMTHVLIESGQLQVLLSLLYSMCDAWCFVVVCHGHAATVATAIRQAHTAHTQSLLAPQRFVLVEHSAQHTILFPKCVAVVHHGGIGTTSACVRAGVPQLVLSVMYDQHSNGARVKELKLGETLSVHDLCNTDIDASDMPQHTAVNAASVLRAVLTACTSPARRLRCACVGRKVRLDPAEDGVATALLVLWQCIYPNIPYQGLRVHVQHNQQHKASQNMSDSESDRSTSPFTYTTIPDGLLTLPNDMQIHSHFDRAPEETVFLYEEIFERQVYRRAVQDLQPGDLVVDVGANIGMFALYAARHVKQASPAGAPPLQVLAIEPIQANYTLLQRNLQLHKVCHMAYRCAVSRTSGGSKEVWGEQDSAARLLDALSGGGELVTTDIKFTAQKAMLYYPHMPGNSCSADNVTSNTTLQDAFMNKEVVHSARRGSVEEVCAVFTLSEVLDHCCAHLASSTSSAEADCVGEKRKSAGDACGSKVNHSPRRIALLKIDVEGDEYETVQSLSRAHWLLVDRVIIESHPLHVRSIVASLVSFGFVEGSILSEADCTGNTLIFAFR